MDITTEAVHAGINMARLRAEVASENIANADIAGYRVKRADFSDAIGLLKQAETDSSMDGERLKSLSSEALRNTVSTKGSDVDSSVQLDGEVAELESASVSFQSLTTVMSRRFALMQLAMAGRS